MKWDFNIWTGNSIANVSDNGRIMRLAGKAPYLYKAEFWGDYSFRYPVRGPWRKSLPKAKEDLSKMSKKYIRRMR